MSIESATTANTTGAQAPVVSLAQLAAALPLIALTIPRIAPAEGESPELFTARRNLTLHQVQYVPVLLQAVPALAVQSGCGIMEVWQLPAAEALPQLYALQQSVSTPDSIKDAMLAMFHAGEHIAQIAAAADG